jgi:hypothetical protein
MLITQVDQYSKLLILILDKKHQKINVVLCLKAGNKAKIIQAYNYT